MKNRFFNSFSMRDWGRIHLHEQVFLKKLQNVGDFCERSWDNKRIDKMDFLFGGCDGEEGSDLYCGR